MIIDVRRQPGSQYRPAYMRATQEFAQSFNGPIDDPRKYLEEFGKSINAKVIFTSWSGDLAEVTGLKFNTEADYAWFLLRYS